MTWILHLSDLHLGPAQKYLDDQKEGIEPSEDRLTSAKVLRATLKSLRNFVASNGKPDAVAISGDLTNQSDREGFDEFDALIREDFPDLWPPRGRIVVTPGNHDVLWDAKPGTRVRYRDFLRVTRGCVTPLLEGVDYQLDGKKVVLNPSATSRPHLLEADQLLVVPLNTSNWCGVIGSDLRKEAWTDETWREKLDNLDDDARAEVLLEVARLRQYDLARFSRAQADAIAELFETKGIEESGDDDDRVRIAVLHHQLLPVSTREEVKAFESIIDLGLIRETLRRFGIQVVLHGHKHAGWIYWDAGRMREEAFGVSDRRLLVLAAPSDFAPEQPVLRIIELGGVPQARLARVISVGGVETARANHVVADEITAPLWRSSVGSERTDHASIIGGTVNVVYSRLRALFEESPSRKLNLYCEIEDPTGAQQLPDEYPETGKADPEAWFTALVDWWQRSESKLVRDGVLRFNHGERVYRGNGENQIVRAAKILVEKWTTTRGIVELVSPGETGTSDAPRAEGGPFPAFVLAQLVLIDLGNESRRLDCLGYFRKQEMRYWWPVNVAELARIQSAVLKEIRELVGREEQAKFVLGRVSTLSAVALAGDKLPRVAVPEIDRAVETPDRLWQMASVVYFPDSVHAETARDNWRTMLDELKRPVGEALRAAKAGPKELRRHLIELSELKSSPEGDAVADTLNQLASIYGDVEGEFVPATKRDVVESLLGALERHLKGVL